MSVYMNKECPICLEDYGIEKHKAVVTNCGHVFGKECADVIFKGTLMDDIWKTDKECPVCRQKVTEYKDLPAPQQELADSVDSLSSGSFVDLGGSNASSVNSVPQPEFEPTLEKDEEIISPLTPKSAPTADEAPVTTTTSTASTAEKRATTTTTSTAPTAPKKTAPAKKKGKPARAKAATAKKQPKASQGRSIWCRNRRK